MAKTPNIKGYVVDRCRFGRVAPRSLIGVYFGILFAEWFVSLAFLEFSCIVSILYSFAVNEPFILQNHLFRLYQRSVLQDFFRSSDH